ncbi:uncharacterized protein LOC134265095 [Saccostrea cucullata]|uniref:uncharacterized protein LOC134265095 n=1 Tax=Saccostrea cuccullata TaxID=36930 RepID=UPI002ED482F5
MKKSCVRLFVIYVASLYHVCSANQEQVKENHSENNCGEFPKISNGQIKYTGKGKYVEVSCNEGFYRKGDDTFKCDHHTGYWSPHTTNFVNACQSKSLDILLLESCFHYVIWNDFKNQGSENNCSDGYYIKRNEESYESVISVHCYDDTWYFSVFPSIEPVRDCERVPKDQCNKPQNIPHAKWIIESDTLFHRPTYMDVFTKGTKIHYYCVDGYSLIGESTVINECVENSGPSKVCQVPIIPNGECKCWTSRSSTCSQVYNLNRVACTCDSGYQSVGEEVLTCKDGKWDHYTPSCISISPTEISVGDTTEDNSHMNTLAVVIATACSVLGLLLMVMVIVILRRKKPSHHHHQRLYDQGTMPPPYGRVYPIDEHDRVALIGYDSARLPTYEEATRDTASQQVASPRSAQEFRPLPNIPFQLRSPALPSIDSTSRHSVTTTTTGNAEVFGSIDTVNFSMSDASTAGTVDTIDSRTSRPSRGSRTATAGSLESSRENLSSDDAPLLENNTLELNSETQDEVIEEENKES